MSRVVVYVDGFNLYFGLRSKGWRKYYWLDLADLARALIKPEQRLEAIHYFTSRILPNGSNSCDMDRQNIYLEALSTVPLVTLHFGRFMNKPQQCRACGTQWRGYEEKMTDVIIAQPPGRNSASLCRAASGYFTIGEAKLRCAQLPARIERWDGRALARPDHWR